MELLEMKSDSEIFCTTVTDCIECFDSYGFAVFKKDSYLTAETKVTETSMELSPIKSVSDWHKLFSKWIGYNRRGLGIKLFNMIKKGVPNRLRGELWSKLLEVEALKQSTSFNYEENVELIRTKLVKLGISEFNTTQAEEVLSRLLISDSTSYEESETQTLRQIFLDVGRTFPTHILFLGDSPEAIEGRASLFRILALYANYNPKVGYCQGMSFLAGMLAMVLSEVDAFWCLVVLLQKFKYLRGFFDVKLEKIQNYALVFDQLLKQREPQLWNHLSANGVHPLMYVTPWFMCLFTSLPCWDTVLTIWDLVLLRGVVVIFQTAIALMQVMKTKLLAASDVNVLISLLQRPPVDYLKRSVLLPAVWKTRVQRWEIDSILTMIVEEKKLRAVPSTTIKKTESSTAFFKRWTTLRGKLNRKKDRSKENRLLKTFTKIFNSDNRPELMQTPEKQDARLKNGLKFCQELETSCSGSTSKAVSRLRRLKTINGKFVSTESLSTGVRSLVGSPAEQKFSFQEFTHPLPLRENQGNTFGSYPTSPETEMSLVKNTGIHTNASGTSCDSTPVKNYNCDSPYFKPLIRRFSVTSWDLPSPFAIKTSNAFAACNTGLSAEKLKVESQMMKKLRII